ncbi:MAG: UbiA family prenyltransferase [Methanobacteriaceae archaeon]|jgi:geranylgeranylglycerol-phosphate geranylgeranyltransferase|nr:UbiA family prenyltransferase [Methanobacteriaceae archaeon]
MNPYINIIRPGNVMMALVAVILMAIIANYYKIPLILGLIAVFFVMSGGNVINDYFDYNIDLINRPDRPIPSGKITLKNARNYAYILFIIAIFIGILITYFIKDLIPFLIILFSIAILYLYAYKFKGTVLVGNFIVGLLTALCFVFSGYIIGIQLNSNEIMFISLFLGLFALIMTMAREITKDMEDIVGDEKENIKTLPILIGLKKSSYGVIFLIILDCILSPVVYFLGIFNIYYILIIAIAILLFLYGAFIIFKSQSNVSCNKTSKFLKIGMLISFIAFAIGSF